MDENDHPASPLSSSSVEQNQLNADELELVILQKKLEIIKANLELELAKLQQQNAKRREANQNRWNSSKWCKSQIQGAPHRRLYFSAGPQQVAALEYTLWNGPTLQVDQWWLRLWTKHRKYEKAGTLWFAITGNKEQRKTEGNKRDQIPSPCSHPYQWDGGSRAKEINIQGGNWRHVMVQR